MVIAQIRIQYWYFASKHNIGYFERQDLMRI